MIPYREVYDRWQRSKSFGDPRDLPSFSKDMNETTGTTDFNAGIDPGWWTRTSTAADVNVFEPIARATGLEAVGGGIGSLFGGQGEEIGKRVARSLPRTVAQTLPLVAAEFIPGLQAPATYGLIGTTGALFGAQTYAETGSPTAAAISGVTAAALPGVGKVGGEIGVRTLGPEVERVLTKEGTQYLPKAAGDAFKYKAARFAGSQAAMVGALEGSSALQAKALGQPFDPLSPEFLAQQVPFSLLDLASTARAKIPTADQARLPIKLPQKPSYTPPEGDPAEVANLGDMLDRMTGIVKDQNITPEEKSKALGETLKTVMDPLNPTTPQSDKVIIIGHPKVAESGAVKVYVTQAKGYNIPEHSNVWINHPEQAIQHINPDGSVAFVTDRKNVNSNVLYPASPSEFPAMRRQKGDVTLPESPQTVEGAIDPATDLLSLRQKFQQLVKNDVIWQTALGKEPKDPDKAVAYWTKAIDKMTPEHLKPGFKDPFDYGLGSTVPKTTFEAQPQTISAASVFSPSEQQVLSESGVDPFGLETTVSSSSTADEFMNNLTDLVEGKPVKVYHGAATEQEALTPGRYVTVNPKEAARFPFKARGLEGESVVHEGETAIPEHVLVHKQAQDLLQRIERGEISIQDAETEWNQGLREYQLTEPLKVTVKRSIGKIETAHQTAADAQGKIDAVPQTAEDVVDVLYHGTQWPVQKFVAGQPVYFTSDLVTARSYAQSSERYEGSARTPPREGKPRVLRVKGPFGKLAEVEDVERVMAAEGIPGGDITDVMYGGQGSDKVMTRLKAEGFDGVNYFDQDPRTGDTTSATLLFNPEKLQIEMTRAALKQAVDQGATPAQAVERVKLQQQTPVVDKNLQVSAVEREALHQQLIALSEAARGVEQPLLDPETGKPLTLETERERDLLRVEANKRLKAAGQKVEGVSTKESSRFPEKPQAVYDDANAIKDTDGKPFKTRELAEAFKEADPDLADYTVRDQGKGKGFTLARQINKEEAIGQRQLSLEPTPEERITTPTTEPESAQEYLAEVVEKGAARAEEEPDSTEVFTPPAEDRPDESFNDYMSQIDLAVTSPIVFKNSAGFGSIPEAYLALRQFRTALMDVFGKGKEGVDEVNAALEKMGMDGFLSEKEMLETFRKVRSGLEEFTNRYRSLTLGSKIPHDPVLTAEIGVLHPDRGAMNFLDWYIANQEPGLIRDLAEGIRKFVNFSPIDNVEGKGFWYDMKNKRTNINHLPADREDALGQWGTDVLHELAHDTVRDLRTRNDPAAVEFKGTLQRILKALRDSKQLPSEVRKAINLSLKEGWYEKGADFYRENYDKALPGRDSWKGVHYSLQNEYELISGIFSSPELVRIMQNTTMPKSPVPVLNFFAKAWARMFGYTPNAENAFAKLITSYDNYLGGTRNARGYNGNSYIRDSLMVTGTTPQQMSSRMKGIEETYNRGDLGSSIHAFEREMEEGLLPATTVAGPLNENMKTQLVTGDAKSVGEAVDALLPNELPQAKELWLRLHEDLKIAKGLYDNAQKGNIYAELSLFQEGLKNQRAKLNSMLQSLTAQEKALGRWNTMDSLGNSTGMERLWSQSLQGEQVPKPTEQTGNEDIALQALGLSPKTVDYITGERRRLAATGEKPLSFVERMFKFASFVAREIPIFNQAYQVMHEGQAVSHRRMTEMEVVRNSDPKTKGWSKQVANANMRVSETPGLNDIVSDLLRRANVLEKMKQPVTFDDPEMQTALRRASDAKRRDGRSDRQDVMTAFNSEAARAQYRVDKIIPEHLDMANRGLTAIAIIGREIGMPATKAIELSEQLHAALKQLRDPDQQIVAAESLRQIAAQMQPATFMKVLQQTNGFINDAQKHLKMLQSFRYYTGEQRYGKFHLVMSREGEPYREGFMTEKAARARANDLASDGWVLEDIVPKEHANVAGYLRAEDPLIASQRELDQQTLNRLESVIADLPADRQELLRPMVQRAAEYEASAAAFSPVPTQASPRRKFRAGRETLDMMANAAEETKRFVNWMRHREGRIMTTVTMLDPEMLSNRSLKDYTRQFVDNQLAADNPIARRFNEAAFYWYLAANFGNDVLESMQTLTTGMASVISETGSVRDAAKYIGGASKKVFQRYVTGKWGDKETEWFINRMSADGMLGLPTWGDVYDPTAQNYFEVNGPKSPVGKTLNSIRNGLRGYKGIFIRHNDMVGSLAGFQLGRDMGMSLDEARSFAVGVKDRGLYSGGKVQRPVGMYSMKEKAVPQLMGSLKTYIMGWFSQLAHTYKVGFAGAPGDFTPAQRAGAKKAFMYLLGSQAALAGSLGLPGVGQAIALLKQTTGLDLKGWTRQNLSKMFGEDQDDYGGFLTGLALHGLLSQAAPFDISGRQLTDVPFTGVSSWKGFDLSNIMPTPFSMASDFLGGINNLAKGADPSKAFPIALRGPIQLIHGEGDIRNSKGDLLYKLSPQERFWKALGMESFRVAAAKEIASTVQSMNDAAEARKTMAISAVADLVRRGDTSGAQRRMVDIKKANPDYDMTQFVRSVATKVEKQTMPYDWRREVNPALDFVGMGPTQAGSEQERMLLRQGVAHGLGLQERPDARRLMTAASVDDLMNSDPYLSRAAALQRLSTTRRTQHRSSVLTLPELQ